jgi:uncharacterized protein (TIGR02145 family)
MRTKSRILFYVVIVAVISSIFTVSCKKDSEDVPVLTTTNPSAVKESTATSGGNITSDGGSEVTARGVCWSTSATPTISDSKTTDGTGIGTFTSSITGLNSKTTYYVRAYATNSNGTGYGDALSFTTADLVDIDGNVYHFITIGTQVWLVENLKVTKYRNGNPITHVPDTTAWSNLSTEGYCDYLNSTANGNTYGHLYNWYAVTDSRNIAPAGCHIPTDAEWQTLVTYLGGNSIAGGKMKETGTTHWTTPNTSATNSSGFTALPGGDRLNDGIFYSINVLGAFWSATSYTASNAYYFYVDNYEAKCNRLDFPKKAGFSVRCIKD